MDERNRACDETVRKNARAFEPKIAKDQTQAEDSVHRRGCRCKKSFCLKRYCECFNGKVKCTQVCRCNNCQNMFGTEPSSAPKKAPAPDSEDDTPSTPAVEPPTTPKKEADLEPLNSFMSPAIRHQGPALSPTMTPLLGTANWDMNNNVPSFAGGVFACSPLRPEDLANLMPTHMATPQSKEDSGVPAFSPGLHPIDEIDPNEPMSFLISPVKGSSPLKMSPIKNLGSPSPHAVAKPLSGQRTIFTRSSPEPRKAENFRMTTVTETSSAPSTKSVQKIVGSCFASPQKPPRPSDSTPVDKGPRSSTADGPPTGLLPRRTSPRKRDFSLLTKTSSLSGLEAPPIHKGEKGLPPRAPGTPDQKKRKVDPTGYSPHVSPLWSRSPHPKSHQPNLGKDLGFGLMPSPLGVRDLISPNPCRKAPTVSTIKLSPMCTRMVDPSGPSAT